MRPTASSAILLYEYGAMAWFWRVLIAVCGTLAMVFLAAGLRSWNLLVLLAAVSLLAPAWFFGMVVAIRAHRIDGEGLDVDTLLFVRRRVALNHLGAPRVRVRYRSIPGDLVSPRVWVPVKGSLPIYFDLLGRIPDRQEFLATIRLRADELQRAE